MEDTFNNPFMISSHHQPDENDSPTEAGSETPPSASATKLTSTPSPKKSSKRGLHKRVVSVPIKDVEGSKLKGGEITNNTPPSDSWAWRKYGQKPIKGSPYPRGYYKCSSSKGCPARKQVERSSEDPTMLLITYSCEHNHPGPTSRNSNAAAAKTRKLSEVIAVPEPEPEEKFTDLRDDQFSWFVDMDTTSSTVLESPIFAERTTSSIGDFSSDLAMFFPMEEEDESLFADLGELPECSVVFRRGGGGSGAFQRNEEQQRQMCTATPPWFGTSS